MNVTKSKVSNLRFAHEDDLAFLLSEFKCDGTQPLYILRSEDDECFFVSDEPIDIASITCEFPEGRFCINNTVDFDEDAE